MYSVNFKKVIFIGNATFITRNQIATGIAILIYAAGITGIIFFDRDFFIQLTPLGLLLMLLLLFYTQQKINMEFFLFFLLCFTVGIVLEIPVTKAGILFGSYQYGNVLGPTLNDVPFIIGVNWFIIIYCTGITMQKVLNRIISRMSVALDGPPPALKTLSIVVDGAVLAVLFYWLMEPAATKLGYWKWNGDGPKFYNYACWFIISTLLLSVFHYCKFEKQNKFAVNLLLIQAMYFLLVKTFL